MEIEKAREVAADVLVNGITTKFLLADVRAAFDAFFFEGLMHKDNRAEQGAQLILQMHIDTLTVKTTEMEK